MKQNIIMSDSFLFIKLSTPWQNRLSQSKSLLDLNWTGLVLALCSINYSFISLPDIILHQIARCYSDFLLLFCEVVVSGAGRDIGLNHAL